jgi:Flp pilus assembly protein TadD
MSRRRQRCLTGLAAFSMIGTMIGCQTTPSRELGLTPMAQSSIERTASHTPNISPQKAAKLALEAAVQMEKSGHERVAVEQYEKARQLDPKLTQVAHRLAVLHDRQGDFARAAIEYKKALEARPKDADLLNDMAYHCYQRGDWSGAETWLRQALAVDPKHQRAWINLGMTLAQQGKTKEGFEAFAKVVSPAEAKSNLGMILAQRGQYEDARQAFRESLALEPDSPLTRAALTRLEKPTTDATAMGSKPMSPRITAN